MLQWLDALQVECDRVTQELRELESNNPSTNDLSNLPSSAQETITTTTTTTTGSIPNLERARSRSKSGEPLGSYGSGSSSSSSSSSSNNNNATFFSSSIPSASLGRSGSQLRKMTSLDSAVYPHQASVTFQLPHSSMSSPPLPPAGATVAFSA